MNIYAGKPVKTTKEDGTFEILKVDNYTETIFCIAINSIDRSIKEFDIASLKEI